MLLFSTRSTTRALSAQVFTGNKTTCMKILPNHVARIMSLAAQHLSQAPQLLDLLNAVVKVEELDLPLEMVDVPHEDARPELVFNQISGGSAAAVNV